MNQLTCNVFVVTLAIGVVSCRKQGPENSASQPETLISESLELIPIPKARTAVELASFRTAILAKASAEAVGTFSEKALQSHLRMELLTELRTAGGIPRTQLTEMLTALVGDGSTCGGANCSRVFGIHGNEVDQFLDDTLAEVKSSAALKKPEMAPLRVVLLGSLRRPPHVPHSLLGRATVAAYESGKELLSGAGFHVSDGHLFGVEITPADFANAVHEECSGNVCQATILKPVKVSASVPLSFNSAIKVTYIREYDAAKSAVIHAKNVSGQIVPISIFGILNVGVEIGGDIEELAKKTVVPRFQNVTCATKLSCNLPFLSLGMRFSRQGIDFTGNASLQAFGYDMFKVKPKLAESSYHVDYSKIPQAIRDGVAKAKEAAAAKIEADTTPDVSWEQFLSLYEQR